LTWREALEESLQRAVTKGYPHKISRHGVVVPKGHKEMTTLEAHIAIEQLHEDAAFLGIRLIETPWEGKDEETH
jgi:hypothetical protein